MYEKWTALGTVSWGSLMPIYTNMAVINIVYSIIAPFLLLWSTVGMGLFYLAYRCNVLYVAKTQIDMCGLIYSQALKQLFSGVYIAESNGCLILTILCHISLLNTLNPLLHGLYMPVSYKGEGADRGGQNQKKDKQVQGSASLASVDAHQSSLTSEQSRNGNKTRPMDANFIFKRLKSWFHRDFTHVGQLVHHESYEGQQCPKIPEKHAYLPPSAVCQTPLLWIPTDHTGISKEEVLKTSEITPISNQNCRLDTSNRIEWDTEGPQPHE